MSGRVVRTALVALLIVGSVYWYGWAGFWCALWFVDLPNAMVGWKLRSVIRRDIKFWTGYLAVTQRKLNAMTPGERQAFKRRIEVAADR